eukprot:1392018-Amorphochlora_amoeboformis.AAC.1
MRRRPSQSAQRVQNQGVLAGLALLLVLMAPEPRRCIRFLAITHPNAKKRGANERDSKGARLQSKVVAAEKLSHSIREMQRKLEDMQNEVWNLVLWDGKETVRLMFVCLWSLFRGQ